MTDLATTRDKERCMYPGATPPRLQLFTACVLCGIAALVIAALWVLS
jgi:hypothetical protein